MTDRAPEPKTWKPDAETIMLNLFVWFWLIAMAAVVFPLAYSMVSP